MVAAGLLAALILTAPLAGVHSTSIGPDGHARERVPAAASATEPRSGESANSAAGTPVQSGAASATSADSRAATAAPPVASPIARPAEANGPPDGWYALKDRDRGTWLRIDLDPATLDFGWFSFAVPGVGIYVSTAPTTIVLKRDGSAVATYDGLSDLDRQATIDSVFGINRSSGSTERARIRFRAQIDPGRTTGSGELWHDGSRYDLVDTPPPVGPEAALGSTVRALKAQDWGALYDLSFSWTRETISREEMVRAVSVAWSEHGTVTDVRVVSPAESRGGEAGFDTAAATISVTLEKDGLATTYLADVSLLLERDGWKLLSIDKM
ncbi:MAG: hypothetical protein C0498_11935 [Anaerolinea sp.]|nr:hypothetical protein [Anaerolinea sp.]